MKTSNKKKASPDAALDRPSLIKAVVDDMLTEQVARAIQPFTDGIIDYHPEVGGSAIDRVMAHGWPEEDAGEKALSHVFDEHWNNLWSAIRESAFLVGAAYGYRLAGGGLKTPSAVSSMDTDASGASIGDRLDRITGTLGLIHATAAALRADVKVELHEGELIEAIEKQSAACLADLWWIECADKRLLQTPAPTADEHAALTKGAR